MKVVVEETSCWWMAGSRMGWPCPNKARCSSREVISEGNISARVILTEED